MSTHIASVFKEAINVLSGRHKSGKLGPVSGNPYHDKKGRFTKKEFATHRGGKAFGGKQILTRHWLSKKQTGQLGEHLARLYLQHRGEKAWFLNGKGKGNHFPVDLLSKHGVFEVKSGQVNNSKSAQRWRVTIGQPKGKEAAWLKRASPAAKAKYNARKIVAALARKERATQDAESILGRKLQRRTITTIIHPDKKLVDVYDFKGFHKEIRWNHAETAKAYKGTFRYGG